MKTELTCPMCESVRTYKLHKGRCKCGAFLITYKAKNTSILGKPDVVCYLRPFSQALNKQKWDILKKQGDKGFVVTETRTNTGEII